VIEEPGDDGDDPLLRAVELAEARAEAALARATKQLMGRTWLDDLLDHLEVAADGTAERGERAIEEVRMRIAALPPAGRAKLAEVIAAKLAETIALRDAAVGDSLRLTVTIGEWRERPPLPGRDERIAQYERALRDADAVVYEYDELLRELTQLAQLVSV